MSVGGGVHVEVEYQAGKFVPLSNENIDSMKEGDIYDDIFHRFIK